MIATTRPEMSVSEPTLFVAFELSKKTWKLAMTSGLGVAPWVKTVAGSDLAAVERALGEGRRRFGLPAAARVVSCYEAGRDGFWIHRALTALGADNRVVDSASIEVNRRARRAKTDRLDALKLVRMLVRVWCGEQGRVAGSAGPDGGGGECAARESRADGVDQGTDAPGGAAAQLADDLGRGAAVAARAGVVDDGPRLGGRAVAGGGASPRGTGGGAPAGASAAVDGARGAAAGGGDGRGAGECTPAHPPGIFRGGQPRRRRGRPLLRGSRRIPTPGARASNCGAGSAPTARASSAASMPSTRSPRWNAWPTPSKSTSPSPSASSRTSRPAWVRSEPGGTRLCPRCSSIGHPPSRAGRFRSPGLAVDRLGRPRRRRYCSAAQGPFSYTNLPQAAEVLAACHSDSQVIRAVLFGWATSRCRRSRSRPWGSHRAMDDLLAIGTPVRGRGPRPPTLGRRGTGSEPRGLETRGPAALAQPR